MNLSVLSMLLYKSKGIKALKKKLKDIIQQKKKLESNPQINKSDIYDFNAIIIYISADTDLERNQGIGTIIRTNKNFS